MLAIKQSVFKTSVPCTAVRRARQVVRLAAAPQDVPSTTEPSTSDYRREFDSFGSKVIETSEPLRGPEDEKDMWEGDSFEDFGKTMEKFFLPGVVVLGLIIGGIAAGTYNDGADTFIKSATSDETSAELIPAAALTPAPAAPAPGN